MREEPHEVPIEADLPAHEVDQEISRAPVHAPFGMIRTPFWLNVTTYGWPPSWTSGRSGFVSIRVIVSIEQPQILLAGSGSAHARACPKHSPLQV